MRIYTCTPVEFGGGPDFFARDSGLLCRGFQSLGIESHAIMPGASRANDDPDLIRTNYENLESATWWQAQKIDALVLYAWGRPKFRKVALAIRRAGIFLILNQDNGGFISPLAGWRGWLQERWIMSGQGADLSAWLRFLITTLKEFTYGLLITDPLRALHLKQSNVIACVSPQAVDCYRRLCRIYGGPTLADRVTLIPHAVESHFSYHSEPKNRHIVCVGRWDDQIQKRPKMLLRVITRLLEEDPLVSISIAGSITDEIRLWHSSMRPIDRDRIHLCGAMERSELAALLNRSQIFYSPSAYESFGIAAAEALCCGCSVVGTRSLAMPAFEWFVTKNSGTLGEDNVTSHVSALLIELKAWDESKRQPEQISSTWRERLHAPRLAQSIVSMLGQTVSFS